jgi:two-component system response regulator FixJ
MKPRLVYLVDDEEDIRRSLHLMLCVLGYDARQFESGASFLAALPDLASGCVLLDLRTPEIDGLEVQRRLIAAGSGHSTIVMSSHGELGVVLTALEQGAIAFLERPFSRTALEEALKRAFLRIEDVHAYRDYLRSAALSIQQLSSAERQVLELMARGHDLEGIAQRSGIPLMDVEVSRSRIMERLGAETVTDVLQSAFAARRAALL